MDATILYKARVEIRDYIQHRFNGKMGDKTEYIIERLGDISGLTLHSSLDEALKQLETEYCMVDVDPDEYNDGRTKDRKTPDPEDDRILIWEVIPSGHKKVRWHFSGWHWDAEEFYGLDQGELPEDKESLYHIAMEES